MKFLITGGAGFIDSTVIRHIIRETGDSPRYAFEQISTYDRAALDSLGATEVDALPACDSGIRI